MYIYIESTCLYVYMSTNTLEVVVLVFLRYTYFFLFDISDLLISPKKTDPLFTSVQVTLYLVLLDPHFYMILRP